MRHALRRILWIVPMLFVVSIVAFWSLTRGLSPLAGEAMGGATGLDAATLRALPLLLNPSPRNVRSLAQEAVRQIATDDGAAADGAARLARLGGAALPHVLPHLDSLPPAERGRVAVSLAPVAQRMGVGTAEERNDPQAAVLFWHRFWEDRSVDYRPAVVKRSVRRVARQATRGRQEDIRQLDTYALPELIDALDSIDTQEDVARAHRISELAAHITGHEWRVGIEASPTQARVTVARWHRWWRQHGADYVTFDGSRRVSAMVLETAYGKWLSEVVSGDFGSTLPGRPVLDELRERGPVTGWLIVAGLLGGYALGLMLGVLEAAQLARPAAIVLGTTAVVVAALPAAAFAAWLGPEGTLGGSPTTAAAGLVLITAALVSRYQRFASGAALTQEYCQTWYALGASPLRVAILSTRNSATVTASLLGVHLPVVLSCAIVLEHAFGLPGLGPATIVAVARHDVAWLMAMVLVTATAVALAQAVSDAALAALDPRVAQLLADARRSRA